MPRLKSERGEQPPAGGAADLLRVKKTLKNPESAKILSRFHA